MKISLGNSLVDTCTKCRKVRKLDRHHTGSEHMWIKQFIHLRATARYQRFVTRYESFAESDIVPLCSRCHTKIHTLYIIAIRAAIAEKNYKALRKWSWDEAEELMQYLRKVCLAWLKAK
jgi:predicted HNH restriction endonuclease